MASVERFVPRGARGFTVAGVLYLGTALVVGFQAVRSGESLYLVLGLIWLAGAGVHWFRWHRAKQRPRDVSHRPGMPSWDHGRTDT